MELANIASRHCSMRTNYKALLCVLVSLVAENNTFTMRTVRKGDTRHITKYT